MDKKPIREYRFIDPSTIDTSDVPEIEGTNAQCLADALLDIIQLSLDSGMTPADVEEAMHIVAETRANVERARFTLHVKEREPE